MNIPLVVELIDGIFEGAVGILWDVLHVAYGVLQGLAIGLRTWSSSR